MRVIVRSGLVVQHEKLKVPKWLADSMGLSPGESLADVPMLVPVRVVVVFDEPGDEENAWRQIFADYDYRPGEY